MVCRHLRSRHYAPNAQKVKGHLLQIFVLPELGPDELLVPSYMSIRQRCYAFGAQRVKGHLLQILCLVNDDLV